MRVLLLILVIVFALGKKNRNPDLILHIISDGLSQTAIEKYYDHLPNIRERIMKKGITYASHDSVKPATAPGHATIATGGTPSRHGIIGNSIRNIEGDVVNAYSCPGMYGALDVGQPESERKELASRGKPADSCPWNIYGETFATVLSKNNKHNKVISLGIKDRGVIPGAGTRWIDNEGTRRGGDAYWYDGDCKMMSSQYYMDFYPAWVTAFNNGGVCADIALKTWTALGNVEEYYDFLTNVAGWNDEDKFPPVTPGQTTVFPRYYCGYEDGAPDYGSLKEGPGGDEFVTAFTLEAIEHEQMGWGPRHENDGVTDYLVVNYVGHDALLHYSAFDTVLYQDITMRQDIGIGAIMDKLDDKGVDYLIVINADHGAGDNVEQAHLQGFKYAVDSGFGDDWMDAVNALLLVDAYIGVADVIDDVSARSVWFNKDTLASLDLPRIAYAQEFVAEQLRKLPGMHRVRTHNYMEQHENDPIIMDNFHSERSPDVFYSVRDKVYPYTNEQRNRPGLVAGHTTGSTNEDRTPCIISGRDIEKGLVVYRPTRSTQVQRTITAYMNWPTGSIAFDEPLYEVIENRDSFGI